MHSQETSTDIINNEKSIIQELLHFDSANSIVFEDHGWDSRVYIINNGQFVFKFPRYLESRNSYKKEIAALKLLEQIESGVLSPKIKWEHPKNDYFGYEGIQGKRLSMCIDEFSTELKSKIGTDLGSFVKNFQQFNLAEASTMTVKDEVIEFQYKYDRALPVIRQNFNESEQETINRFFYEILPTQLTELGQELRLCHGDLGPYNVILMEQQEIGIIDFGDVGYYDQSKDLIGFDDQSIYEEMVNTYGNSTVLQKKIAIRKKALSALDLPFFIGKKDYAGIQNCVARMRALIL